MPEKQSRWRTVPEAARAPRFAARPARAALLEPPEERPVGVALLEPPEERPVGVALLEPPEERPVRAAPPEPVEERRDMGGAARAG